MRHRGEGERRPAAASWPSRAGGGAARGREFYKPDGQADELLNDKRLQNKTHDAPMSRLERFEREPEEFQDT